LSGKDIVRVPTFVEGFDRLLCGGIPVGSNVLVTGVPGSMKSTFCYYILSKNAAHGKRSVFITLEQKRDKILLQAESMGMNKPENLVVGDIASFREQMGNGVEEDWLTFITLFLEKKKEEKWSDLSLVCIDSLNALYSLQRHEPTRNDLFAFFSELQKLGSTNLLVSEMPLTRDRYGQYGVEDFIVDGIFHLDINMIGNAVERTIQIVKMRATPHTLERYPFVFEDGMFHVLTLEGG